MDTRTLRTKHVGEEIAIQDLDSDNRDVVAIVPLTGDEEFDEEDRKPLAEEMVKRYNRYPLLVAFIQHLGNLTDPAEMEDFIANNWEDVMEDKEGKPIDAEIAFINNPDIFEE